MTNNELITISSLLDTKFDAVFAKMDMLEEKIEDVRGELKGDMAELRSELKGDIDGLRDELKGDMAELRGEVKGDITQLRDDMSRLEGELKSDINGLRVETRKNQSDIHELKLLMENNIILLTNEIKSAYPEAARRYLKSSADIEAMKLDIRMLKEFAKQQMAEK